MFFNKKYKLYVFFYQNINIIYNGGANMGNVMKPIFEKYIKDERNWIILDYKYTFDEYHNSEEADDDLNEKCLYYGYVTILFKNSDIISINQIIAYIKAFIENINELDDLMNNAISDIIRKLDYNKDSKNDFKIKSIEDNYIIVNVEFNEIRLIKNFYVKYK